MKIYLQALAVTLLAGALFVAGFQYWKEKSFPAEAEHKVDTIETMEKQGLFPFSTKTLQGEPLQLSDFKGKIVVVNFWASWCGPCVEEFPSLLKLAEAMNGDMILIAVSGDSDPVEIKKFMKQLKDWDKPWVKIVWDEDRKLAKLYDVDRLPESFIAGTHLQLVKKVIGSINWHTPESVEYMKEIQKR